jgi:hypothetical protein
MVIYDNNKTCVVTPDEKLIEKLKKQDRWQNHLSVFMSYFVDNDTSSDYN